MGPKLTWFVCTIARKSTRNWQLCKEVSAYGIPGKRKPAQAAAGDCLLFWVGGRGFVGEGEVSGSPRVPANKIEAPWPGGTYQYGFIIPFELRIEVSKAVYLPFSGQIQDRTGISKTQLQRSFSIIGAGAGELVRDLLIERRDAESQESDAPSGQPRTGYPG